jgi:hypothetical protein
MPTATEIADARAKILRACSKSSARSVTVRATPAADAAARQLRAEGLVELYTKARTDPGVHELGVRLTPAGIDHLAKRGS